MIRLVLSLLVAGLVFFPAPLSAAEVNSTAGPDIYSLGQIALFSFTDATDPGETGNSTPDGNLTSEDLNQTRRGGEMSARKLFELKQAARQDIRMMEDNASLELSTGLSSTKAQSFAIVCKQCVPDKSTI
jgi:hypothetical protein